MSSMAAFAAQTDAGPERAGFDITTYVVFAVALLLLTSVILFIKVVFFNKRPQKLALIFMLLAVPLYLIYYDDQFRNIPGFDAFQARSWAGPLVSRWSATERFDANFQSDITPAIMVGLILLFHMIVLQRLAARERLQRIANLTSTFFAGSTAATMLGGTIVSTFHLGWQGAVGIGVGFALIYLGALALFAALVELLAALAELAWVWIKRQVFKIATLITRAANWISSLGGRLVSRALIERIRAETAAQEGTFLKEQDDQDQRLIEAYIHDLERKRQARLKAMREKYGDEDSLAELRAQIGRPAETPAASDAPADGSAAPAESSVAPASGPAEDYGPPPPPPRDPFDTSTTPAAATTGASSGADEPTTQQQPR